MYAKSGIINIGIDDILNLPQNSHHEMNQKKYISNLDSSTTRTIGLLEPMSLRNTIDMKNNIDFTK